MVRKVNLRKLAVTVVLGFEALSFSPRALGQSSAAQPSPESVTLFKGPVQVNGWTGQYGTGTDYPLYVPPAGINFQVQSSSGGTSGPGGGIPNPVIPSITLDGVAPAQNSTIVLTDPGTSSTVYADSYHISVPITSAQILAMSATPVQLLAAPGTGKNIVIKDVMFTMVTTSTQYAGGGAVVVQLGSTALGAGVNTLQNTLAASVVTAGAGTSYNILDAANAYVGAANTGLFLSNQTAAFTTGTGTMIVDVWYSIR
jgi:hypothetical protein